jgi:hypothetical protein
VTVTSTIDELLAEFDDLVAWSIASGSPIGYFAAVYRGVTRTVKDKIAAGTFQDNERMTRFDIAFASRYLDAISAWRRGGTVTESWLTSFDRSKDESLVILQHLLLGVNAHMNLDLGCAASAIAPGSELPSLQPDFLLINDILDGLVDHDRLAVDGLSPGFRDLDKVGKLSDHFVDLDIEERRKRSWHVAETLAALTESARLDEIQRIDAQVAQQSQRVVKPPRLLDEFLRHFVRPRETADVRAVIEALAV